MNFRLHTACALLGVLLAATLSGCSNIVNSLDRGLKSTTPGDYHIVRMGVQGPVEEYWLHNIQVTQEHGSDGVFWVKDGNVFELQGPLTVIKLAKGFEGPDQMPAYALTPSIVLGTSSTVLKDEHVIVDRGHPMPSWNHPSTPVWVDLSSPGPEASK